MSRQIGHEFARCDRTDEELVAAIRLADGGDAFRVVYERYYQRIYNFAYLRLRNHDDTEEAVQDAFTAVFLSIADFRGRSSVLSWIYGIAKNTVNNHIRRAKALGRRMDRAEPELVRNHERSAIGTPEEDLILRRCSESVRNEIDDVAGWQSAIFAMRHFENLPIAEISTRTSRSQDAVRSSLCRVKNRIVSAIETGNTAGYGSGVERSPL